MNPLQGEQERFYSVRTRIRAAAKELVVSRGCEGLTLEQIAEQAGCGEDELREHFQSSGQCLLDAYLDFTADFDRRVFAAFTSGEGWRAALRAAGYEAARYIEEKPREISFVTIGLLEAGPLIQAHRARHLQRLAGMIDLGRQELDDPASLGRSVAEAVIGSINALVIRESHQGCRKRPVEFVPDMMYVAVRPYLGHEVAREEMAMPLPRGDSPRPPSR
ncbi:MAG: TetR/AcrR family transcriptional regulator [Solirubrobacterales bacterium]